MNALIVDLAIAPQEYEKLYRQAIRDVYARSRDGRRVRFPVSVLRQFVTREGVHGSFRIVFDQNHKLQGIERL